MPRRTVQSPPRAGSASRRQSGAATRWSSKPERPSKSSTRRPADAVPARRPGPHDECASGRSFPRCRRQDAGPGPPYPLHGPLRVPAAQLAHPAWPPSRLRSFLPASGPLPPQPVRHRGRRGPVLTAAAGASQGTRPGRQQGVPTGPGERRASVTESPAPTVPEADRSGGGPVSRGPPPPPRCPIEMILVDRGGGGSVSSGHGNPRDPPRGGPSARPRRPGVVRAPRPGRGLGELLRRGVPGRGRKPRVWLRLLLRLHPMGGALSVGPGRPGGCGPGFGRVPPLPPRGLLCHRTTSPPLLNTRSPAAVPTTTP